MSFLKKLKKAVNPIHGVKAGISSVKAVAHGDIAGALDPDHWVLPDKPKAPDAASANPNAVDPSQYQGDPNDPSYGSLTDPFTVEDFYNYQDPGYAFELQQGQQALQNSAAAGSGAMSGAALKDLLGYSQNFARTGYNDAFNRQQTQTGNIYQRLMGVAQLGQNAAAGVGNQGVQLAGNAGQAISNAGAAQGAGIVGAGNALGQGATNYWLFKNPQMWAGGAGGSV